MERRTTGEGRCEERVGAQRRLAPNKKKKKHVSAAALTSRSRKRLGHPKKRNTTPDGRPQAHRQVGRHVGRHAARRVRVRGDGAWGVRRGRGEALCFVFTRAPVCRATARRVCPRKTPQHNQRADSPGEGRERRPARGRARRTIPSARVAFPFLGAAGLDRSSSPPSQQQAIDKYTIEKDIAAYVKREFDKRYSPTWHCVVGKNFGAWEGRGRRTGASGVKNTRSPPLRLISRLVCHARDQVLCLLLLGPPGGAAVQERVDEGAAAAVFFFFFFFFWSSLVTHIQT